MNPNPTNFQDAMLAKRIASEDLTMIHEELSARTQMLIRKPTEEVFDAFVEPTAQQCSCS